MNQHNSNTERALTLSEPLALFASAQGIENEDPRTQLHDLLSNAAHTLAAIELDPVQEFLRALETYAEEVDEARTEAERDEAADRGNWPKFYDIDDPDGDTLRVTTFSREAIGTEDGAVLATLQINDEHSVGLTRDDAKRVLWSLMEVLAR